MTWNAVALTVMILNWNSRILVYPHCPFRWGYNFEHIYIYVYNNVVEMSTWKDCNKRAKTYWDRNKITYAARCRFLSKILNIDTHISRMNYEVFLVSTHSDISNTPFQLHPIVFCRHFNCIRFTLYIAITCTISPMFSQGSNWTPTRN